MFTSGHVTAESDTCSHVMLRRDLFFDRMFVYCLHMTLLPVIEFLRTRVRMFQCNFCINSSDMISRRSGKSGNRQQVRGGRAVK